MQFETTADGITVRSVVVDSEDGLAIRHKGYSGACSENPTLLLLRSIRP
jgi:hypothetical protein